MYCNHCGASLPDDATSCSSCGNQVSAESRMIFEVESTQKTVKKTKKNRKKIKINFSFLYPVLAILLVAVVGFGCVLFLGRKSSHISFATFIPRPQGYDDFNIEGDLFASTVYGALYSDDTLIYGPLSVKLQGYTLVEDYDKNADCLLSLDASNTIFVEHDSENNVSYELSDKEGVKASYTEEEGYDSVDIQHFDKLKVGPFPAVVYTASINNGELFIAEYVVFNSEIATESARINVYADTRQGLDQALTYLDQAVLNNVALTAEDTGVTGSKKIGVKN